MQAADMMWVITASTVGIGIGAMGLGTRRQDWAQEGGHAELGLFGVFSLIAALATSPGQIVLLRFLIGLGMGGTTPLCPHWPPSTARTNTAEL
jgi:MFS transporter, AAHS family, 4-hydroxybenzoate transporter